ncbi:hypothetical protein [Novosphingobium pentaromativorans]|nr:hypothetical protein [Novosphingobium pentaromativorans]
MFLRSPVASSADNSKPGPVSCKASCWPLLAESFSFMGEDVGAAEPDASLTIGCSGREVRLSVAWNLPMPASARVLAPEARRLHDSYS